MHFRSLHAWSRTARLLPRSHASLNSPHVALGPALQRLASSFADGDITEDDRKRIYISSGGPNGLFFAFFLASMPNPPQSHF